MSYHIIYISYHISFTTLYRVIKKSLCTCWCTVIVRSTETFWSSCIYILQHTVPNLHITVLMTSLMTAEEHNLTIIIKRLCTQEDCTSPKRPNQLCGPGNDPFDGYRRLFQGIKQPEREDYQSTPFIVHVKKEWIYTSSPHTPPCFALE
jgi:hypothetical protein